MTTPAERPSPGPSQCPSQRGVFGPGDKVLFIDARHIFRQVDRAHREWTPDQLRFLAELVRNYRGEKRSDNWQPPWDEITLPDSLKTELLKAFAAGRHVDVPGLCRQVALAEIAKKGHTLQPGTWVGVTPGEAVDDDDFKQQFETFNKGLETLNAEARDIEQTIARNAAEILEA